jgi:hypothetical protein
MSWNETVVALIDSSALVRAYYSLAEFLAHRKTADPGRAAVRC